MKLIGVLYVLVVPLVGTVYGVSINATHSFPNNLSFIDKLLLSAISKVYPEILQNVSPAEIPILFDAYAMYFIYTDLRFLLIQAKYYPAELTGYPNLDYKLDWESAGFRAILKTNGYTLDGIENITSDTEITEKTVQNIFSVPSFKFKCPSFLYKLTQSSGSMLIIKGVELTISNLEITTKMQYEVIQGLGIQVKNVTTEFNTVDFDCFITYGYFEALTRGGSVKYEERQISLTETIMRIWLDNRYFEANLEKQINCILAGNRITIYCEDYFRDFYVNMNIAQLIYTLAAGAIK